MLSHTSLKVVSAVALAASALVMGAASAAPAFAATTATYGTWSAVTEVTAHVDYTGSVSFGASGVSDATYETTFSDNNRYNENSLDFNNDEWIPAETPFGSIFGASGPNRTKFLRTDVYYEPQTTVYTFATAVPANRLGLAFGDLDYDTVTISAADGSGTPLTGDELIGTSTENAFNLCADSATMPDSCRVTYTDVATVTTNANDVTFDPNVLAGEGVTGWILPSAEIKTLTVVHSGDESSIRTWIAAIDAAPVAPVLANTAAPEAGVAGWVALTLAVLGMCGLVAANRRKVNA